MVATSLPTPHMFLLKHTKYSEALFKIYAPNKVRVKSHNISLLKVSVQTVNSTCVTNIVLRKLLQYCLTRPRTRLTDPSYYKPFSGQFSEVRQAAKKNPTDLWTDDGAYSMHTHTHTLQAHQDKNLIVVKMNGNSCQEDRRSLGRVNHNCQRRCLRFYKAAHPRGPRFRKGRPWENCVAEEATKIYYNSNNEEVAGGFKNRRGLSYWILQHRILCRFNRGILLN